MRDTAEAAAEQAAALRAGWALQRLVFTDFGPGCRLQQTRTSDTSEAVLLSEDTAGP